MPGSSVVTRICFGAIVVILIVVVSSYVYIIPDTIQDHSADIKLMYQTSSMIRVRTVCRRFFVFQIKTAKCEEPEVFFCVRDGGEGNRLEGSGNESTCEGTGRLG